MPAFLSPLFDILTGLAFVLVLLVGIFARPALKPLHGRLAALSLVTFAIGFQILAKATDVGGIGAGGNLLGFAGASFLAGALLVTVSLFLAAHRPRVTP